MKIVTPPTQNSRDRRRCEASGCNLPTCHQKPYCPRHVAKMVYAIALRGTAADVEERPVGAAPAIERACLVCGDPFTTSDRRKVYDTRVCKHRAKRSRAREKRLAQREAS